jgi:hypothetical protein
MVSPQEGLSAAILKHSVELKPPLKIGRTTLSSSHLKFSLGLVLQSSLVFPLFIIRVKEPFNFSPVAL